MGLRRTWMDSSLAMAAHRGLCYDEYEPFVSYGTEATIVSEEKREFANISLITLPLSQADETPLKTR